MLKHWLRQQSNMNIHICLISCLHKSSYLCHYGPRRSRLTACTTPVHYTIRYHINVSYINFSFLILKILWIYGGSNMGAAVV